MSFRIADWPPRSAEIEAAVSEVMFNGEWGQYFSVSHRRLRQTIADQWKVEYVRLCASGTAAIEMALRAAAVGIGDEVIISAFDYPGNLRSIEAVGATPVLVDVAAGAVTPSVASIRQAAGPRVKGVIVSHLFGQAADVVGIRRECDEMGWVLIEDACQVPGMSIDDGERRRAAGTIGHLGILSFGGSKPLTSGNGGAVLTDLPRMHARLKMLFDRPSDTFPLSALQAAVLLPQLAQLEATNQQRSATADFLATLFDSRLSAWSLIRSSSAATTISHDLADARAAPAAVRAVNCSPLDTSTCYYKFAFLARSSAQRVEIVAQATREGIPLGEGFRSMHGLSGRRCRKPTSLAQSETLGERLCVLDHRALMVQPEQYPGLADVLTRIHDRTDSNCLERS